MCTSSMSLLEQSTSLNRLYSPLVAWIWMISPIFRKEHLCLTDAVVLEATTKARHLCDQLHPLVSSVTVAHPNLVKLITTARVKTDARDTLHLVRLLAAGLIVWITNIMSALSTPHRSRANQQFLLDESVISSSWQMLRALPLREKRREQRARMVVPWFAKM